MNEVQGFTDSVVLDGSEYWLRTLSHADVTDCYLSWLRDPDVVRFLEVRFTEPSADNVAAYVSSFDNTNTFLFGIFAKPRDMHVGNISLKIDPNHKTAWHGTMIGDKDYWGRGASEAAHKLLINFAFGELGLRKLYAGVNVRNVAAIFNLRYLGYSQEALLRKHYCFQDEYIDAKYFSLFRDTWEARNNNISPDGDHGRNAE